ncbi:hypothetical protein GCM10011495_40820 [Hymenobacter frigidus]|uniref:Uncharacterized protein n=1 Tax=Hymenobacter frigidus TaxID=1524095 RepID=A0ABQ2AMA9_9BACT|nr:hypothetical protein GCM10011495_40820 [Hymenobacter frigidus]
MEFRLLMRHLIDSFQVTGRADGAFVGDNEAQFDGMVRPSVILLAGKWMFTRTEAHQKAGTVAYRTQVHSGQGKLAANQVPEKYMAALTTG